MARSLNRKRRQLAGQAGDLMAATPLVIAARLARLANAGFSPSVSDRREFAAMGTEKLTALAESWSAMALEALRFNQAMAAAFMKAWPCPWQYTTPTAALNAWTAVAGQLESAALDAANKGIAPVRRRAVGNAHRLSRRPSRSR